ncbi:transcription antitermination factor NusB [Berryella wangjianweii]|uniref:transcription antitermination factor NusB n=1 Tax=Berryella wangjianweii TaxID=2734634 RepID=UPI0021BD7117|nr:transcription antitermination factor NusB [Berryella wangjianweii]
MAVKGKIHERSAARASALALLYSSDITERDVARIVDEGVYPAEEVALPEYAEDLVRGVQQHGDQIDACLSVTSENWALDRMPVVDRGILRLAVYEMLHRDDVPVSVAINEAVELAKRYGGEDDSSRFVNGVLGRIARKLEKGELQAVFAQVAGNDEGEGAAAGTNAPLGAAFGADGGAAPGASSGADAGADPGTDVGADADAGAAIDSGIDAAVAAHVVPEAPSADGAAEGAVEDAAAAAVGKE